MSPSQIIVLATPVFLFLIAVELAYAHVRDRRNSERPTYRLGDTLTSISLGMLSQISAVFTRLFRVGLYTAVYTSLSLVPPDTARTFWFSPLGWLLALVFYDFCYYWLHRLGHEVAVLWAAHVVHHHSQDYNLSTALRQTSSGALLGWIFYLPMAVAGVPPLVFGVVALIDLLYQYWVHTEHIGKLGWFDRWFCSPSNHRVHHAVNDGYVDKNYGGILILWDRLFGSFTEEDDRKPCVYGTRSPLDSWDPLWANVEVYWALAQDSWRARHWGDKLRVWLKPPGWRPADVAARYPKPAFDIRQLTVFEPVLSRAVQWFAGGQFLLLLAGVSAFLWHADSAPLSLSAVWFAVLTAGLWALSGVLQGRLTVLEVLMIETAALATAAAALGLVDLHRVFKPLPLLMALFLVARSDAYKQAGNRFDLVFLLALAASLAGDCFLMFPGYFIPGLVSFLTAHLLYIARFKQGVAWFPQRLVLVATLGYGAAMFAYLAPGLPAGLRLPVAAYVLVIALMAAQAVGRASVVRDAGGWMVAVGALLFMASDTLLAINRFVAPFQIGGIDSPFWVLSTYYAAQLLIVRGCVHRPHRR